MAPRLTDRHLAHLLGLSATCCLVLLVIAFGPRDADRVAAHGADPDGTRQSDSPLASARPRIGLTAMRGGAGVESEEPVSIGFDEGLVLFPRSAAADFGSLELFDVDDDRPTVSDELAESLQLTPTEITRLEQGVFEALGELKDHEAKTAQLVTAENGDSYIDLPGHVGATQEYVTSVSSLAVETLGPERGAAIAEILSFKSQEFITRSARRVSLRQTGSTVRLEVEYFKPPPPDQTAILEGSWRRYNSIPIRRDNMDSPGTKLVLDRYRHLFDVGAALAPLLESGEDSEPARDR